MTLIQKRKNITLKSEWQKLVRWEKNYEIVVFIMYVENTLELTVSFDVDGEEKDYECIMAVEDTDESTPPKEMKKKYKDLIRYFSQHFENVRGIDEVIIV